MLLYYLKMKRKATEKRRGRPKSDAKRARDESQQRETERIARQCPGMYTRMWHAIHQRGKKGFQDFSENWCKTQEFADQSTLYDLCGNCLMRIVEGISANKKKAGSLVPVNSSCSKSPTCA